jgi:uncharacterized membrane protein YfcA
MPWLGLTPTEWAVGALAGLMVGVSKTGVPGVGMLVVPMMAGIFGGRESVGTVLPMLVVGDIFAVAWYRHHARWDKLWCLVPWVLTGMALGGVVMWRLGETSSAKDLMNPLIGALVLVMLGVNLARGRWGEKLNPSSRAGVLTTGAAAGFSTTVSNAAGPVMQIYLTSMGLPKEQFMGTTAWYFFIFNLTKVPIYAALSMIRPDRPIMSGHTLTFNVIIAPVIIAGAFIGRWLLPRVPQQLFNTLMLALAGIAALRLIVQ